MNDELIINITTLTEEDKASGLKHINFDWEDLIEHKDMVLLDDVIKYLEDHLWEYDINDKNRFDEWILRFKEEMKKHIIK